jgi:microsomal dipeptidase-like Zn-dependent dipeptidase
VDNLHEQIVVGDAHNDLLALVALRGPDHWGAYFREHWYPQLLAGGVNVQVLPVMVDHEFRPEGALRRTLRMIEAAHRIAETNTDVVALCRSASEIDEVLDAGRIALVLALEGCAQIDEDVELLRTMSARTGRRPQTPRWWSGRPGSSGVRWSSPGSTAPLVKGPPGRCDSRSEIRTTVAVSGETPHQA